MRKMILKQSVAQDKRPEFSMSDRRRREEDGKGRTKKKKSCVQFLESCELHGTVYNVGDDVYVIETDDQDRLPSDDEDEVAAEDVCCVCCGTATALECVRCIGRFHPECVGVQRAAAAAPWMCKGCEFGMRLPNRHPRTACEKFLWEDGIIGLGRITAFAKNRSGNGDQDGDGGSVEFACNYYVKPEQTHTGRQAHHGAREVFLSRTKEHWEPLEAILWKTRVVSKHDAAGVRQGAYQCDYDYNEDTQLFVKHARAANKAHCKDGFGGTADGGEASDGEGDSDDDNDPDYLLNKRRNILHGVPTPPLLGKKTSKKICRRQSGWGADAADDAGAEGGNGGKGGNGGNGLNLLVDQVMRMIGSQSSSGPCQDSFRQDSSPLLQARRNLCRWLDHNESWRKGGDDRSEERADDGDDNGSCSSGGGIMAREGGGGGEVGRVTSRVIGRDAERESIAKFVKGTTSGTSPGVLYICGLPGTGKTASVMDVLADNGQDLLRSDVRTVCINAYSLVQPDHVYSKMFEMITGHRCASSKEALAKLNRTNGSDGRMTLLVVDEIDRLVTTRMYELYNLFEWATRPGTRLAVIGISNTHDFESRVIPRMASRITGGKLAFLPYNLAQLEALAHHRLGGTTAFSRNVIHYVAAKIATTTGDVRQMIDLFRRGLDAAIAEGADTVTVKHMMGEIKDAAADPAAEMICTCSLMEKAVLAAVVLVTRASKRSQVTVLDVHKSVDRLSLSLQDVPRCYESLTVGIVSGLVHKGLLLAAPAWHHIHTRVSLKVDPEYVVSALKQDKRFAELKML